MDMMARTKTQHSSIFSRLIGCRSGNFGMITAIILPVAAAGAGVAMDLNRMVQIKSILQDSADSGALAAANALAVKNVSDDEAVALAKKFMASQFYNIVPKENSGTDSSGTTAPVDVDKAAIGSVERTTATGGKTYDVKLTSSYTMNTNGMTALLGWKTVTIKVSATAQSTTETKNALSMFLVLDRSGSMEEDTATVNEASPTTTVTYDCGYYNNKGKWVSKTCSYEETNYYTKIESLKLAVASLTTQLNTADPSHWATCKFSGKRFGHLTSNIAESLNAWLLEARAMPILGMMELIHHKIMSWFYERRVNGETSKARIGLVNGEHCKYNI